ncbi:MAG: hypothetical protein RLZZ297_839 [Chloroflexota bacterium]|jgi:2-dehydropantoate 2-reductase
MRIAIIGAGAMGSLVGSYLAESNEVWLLDPWRDHVDAITANGLIRTEGDTAHVAKPHATTDVADIPPCDIALVLVKYHQTAWAAQQAVRVLGENGICVTLQNGVGNADIIAAAVPPARVCVGVTSLGATLVGPGVVRHAGTGQTVFATPHHAAEITALADAFSAAGLPASTLADVDSIVWGKLVVNVGINALTGILRVPNGVLTRNESALSVLHDAVNEAVIVAHAVGVTLPFHDPLAHVIAVAQATAANRSSTLQDVLRGSPSEIPTINGAIVRIAERYGIAVPTNALLVSLMAAVDSTVRERIAPN